MYRESVATLVSSHALDVCRRFREAARFERTAYSAMGSEREFAELNG